MGDKEEIFTLLAGLVRDNYYEGDHWFDDRRNLWRLLLAKAPAYLAAELLETCLDEYLLLGRLGQVSPFAQPVPSHNPDPDALGDLFSAPGRPAGSRAYEKQLIDELISATRLYDTTAAVQELFDFTIRLRAFAPFNAMLLHVQKPGITHAATAGDWARRFARRPRLGARPLVILRTMGPVDFVYDIQDTEGKPLPEGAFSFPTLGHMPESHFATLLARLKKQNIATIPLDQGDAKAGWIRVQSRSGKPRGRHLYLLAYNRNHPVATRFVTLAHELAHMFLGHLGGDGGWGIKDRHTISLALKELEAETTAYLVAKRNNLTPRSESYLTRYKVDLPKLELYTVFRAANAVETALGVSATQLWKESDEGSE